MEAHHILYFYVVVGAVVSTISIMFIGDFIKRLFGFDENTDEFVLGLISVLSILIFIVAVVALTSLTHWMLS